MNVNFVDDKTVIPEKFQTITMKLTTKNKN